MYHSKQCSLCTVVGCKNFDPPDAATLHRSGDDAVVVCNKTGETWFVTCRDGYWLGAVGNCTKFGEKVFLAFHYVIVSVVFVIRFRVL